MTYYINPIWFYLMNISTEIKVFLCILGGVPIILCIIGFMIWTVDGCVEITNLADHEKKVMKMFKKTIITSLIILFIGILVPSKRTCIEMMIASQVTHENVKATKEEIYEIVDYVIDKVEGEDDKNESSN